MLTYELPQELIAQRPCEPRDAARLLVLDRVSGAISHRIFRELPEFLQPGDCLVLNDTRVIPARLFGKRADTGGKVELLLLEPEGEQIYHCLGQPGRRLRPGTRLLLNHGSVQAEILSSEGAEKRVRFDSPLTETVLRQMGQVPLPPYIRRPADSGDSISYQTVYARVPGAVAAPTAGLHFTEELLQRIREKGIRIAFVTLHVGWGTFKPVGERELREGRLHEERFSVSAETLEAIRLAKRQGGRVVAVGTTVVRALESWRGQALIKPKGPGPFGVKSARSDSLWTSTNLFIRPPFQFKGVDALVTNFHLPGTSLLYLVAAFAGEEKALAAYREAIQRRYRFYSYGDAMLIR